MMVIGEAPLGWASLLSQQVAAAVSRTVDRAGSRQCRAMQAAPEISRRNDVSLARPAIIGAISQKGPDALSVEWRRENIHGNHHLTDASRQLRAAAARSGARGRDPGHRLARSD